MAIATTPVVAGTPTGPWFERGTPEHAWIVLRERMPQAEVFGEPPRFGHPGDD